MSESDVWGQDPPGGGRAGGGPTFGVRARAKEAVKARVVRDDWDDDDDDDDEEPEKEQEGREQEEAGEKEETKDASGKGRTGPAKEDITKKIWEEANKWGPMSELVVASASTRQNHLQPPPPAALQPTLRILKRPSANNNASGGVAPSRSGPSSPGPTSGSGSSSGGTSPAPRGTLAEREAQYQEARSRIFGESSAGGGVVVVRDPLGSGHRAAFEPETEPGVGGHGLGRPAKGFGERRRTKK